MGMLDEWVHAELVRQGFTWFDIEDPPLIYWGDKWWYIVRQYDHKERIDAHKTRNSG